ncbi:MAG: hypothetical protein JWL74_1402 [Alphaproteobacteria bacterium]|jgi:hypothetical protein|nr:hypothetical protein [Alphaproteobacteria bacterium]
MTRRSGQMTALLLIPVGLYLVAAAAAYFSQTRLVFPNWAVPAAGPLAPGIERLTLDRPNGDRLQGLHIPARQQGGDGTLLLVFSGNASNAQALAEHFATIYPEHAVAAFHYRGYSPSTGTPGSAALIEDAPAIHDLLVERYRPKAVVAIGISLGSGVAAQLAKQRPLAGLILITPFDSLGAMARESYAWLPISLLFKHEMSSVEALGDVRIPVAVIAAGRDTLIRPARTEALRAAISNLVFDRVFPLASHNDILAQPGIEDAMRAALEAVRPPKV